MKKLILLALFTLTGCTVPVATDADVSSDASDASSVTDLVEATDGGLDAREGSAMPPLMDAGLSDAPDAG